MGPGVRSRRRPKRVTERYAGVLALLLLAGLQACSASGEQNSDQPGPGGSNSGAVATSPTTATSSAPATGDPTTNAPTNTRTGTATSKTTSGTGENSKCDPNYSGACVPIASDVDCAGGKGDGPAYVKGPVDVIGDDIYGLDGDRDGVGCEVH
jgi:hypothetical protein